MRSIKDDGRATQYAELAVSLSERYAAADATAPAPLLDINRETRSTGFPDSVHDARKMRADDSNAPDNTVKETGFSSPLTEKKTPDLTFSEDEKRAFRDEQARRARGRGDAAFSIAATLLAEKKKAYEDALDRYPGAMSEHAVSNTAKRVYKLARKYEKPDELARAVASWTADAKDAEDVKRAVRYAAGDSALEAGCGTAAELEEYRARLGLDVDAPDAVDEIICAYGQWQKAKSLFGSFLKCRKEKRRDDVPAELVRRADGSFSLSGRWRCRSKWACPECAAGLLYGDAMRLRSLFAAIQRENAERVILGAPALVCLLVTLTAPHKAGEDLREQMRLFSSCFSDAFHTRAMRDARARLGFVGSVRCFDHTLKLTDGGKIDFHTHFHNVLIFESDELACDDAPALLEFSALLFENWAEKVAGAYGDGRKASARAFHVERVALDANEEHDAATVADYAAKACALPGYLTKAEKKGERKAGAGMLPFEVLDAYAVERDEGKRKALAGAWAAYVEGTRGFHRMDFSNGLAARFGIDETAPAVVARYELPAPLAAAALTDPAILEHIKRAVSDGDLDAACDAIRAAGVDVDAVELLTPAAPDPLAVPMTADAAFNASLAALLRDWAAWMEERKAERAENDKRYSAAELDERPY